MRKLKLQVQISIDGYIAGPNGEMDWMEWNWDDELKSYVNDLTDSTGTILLGRKMADGFISHWESVMANPSDPQFTFAKKMVETPKVVFSRTLAESSWNNTVVAKGDLAAEIDKLKKQEGGTDIIVYGGASLVSSLIREGLIDEYHLFVNPTAIGKGMSIFSGLDEPRKFVLEKVTPFECGIVGLHYVPA